MCSSAMTKEVTVLRQKRKISASHNGAFVYLILFPGANTKSPIHHH